MLRVAILAFASLLSACSESAYDSCMRSCEQRFPHDGAARASCQLDCSSQPRLDPEPDAGAR